MATTRTKYFVLSSSLGNHTDFSLDYGSVTIAGEVVTFVGSTEVDSIFLRPGVVVDFTFSGNAADKIYLSGTYSSYTKSISGTVMTLQKGSGSLLESVSFIRNMASEVSDSLIFSDGVLSSYDLFNNLKYGDALPALIQSETSSNPTGPASSGALLGSVMKAFSLDPNGDTFAPSSPNVALIVVGGLGVDTVYVREGGQVDATLLGSNTDLVYFRGSWSDYSKSVSGNVISFTRSINGQTELVKVVAGNGSLNDQLIFTNGSVGTYESKYALIQNINCTINSVLDLADSSSKRNALE